MREKTPKLVISFKSATDAMALENVASPGLGRIIPLPAKISAGCGLAFCADPLTESKILAVMEYHGINYNAIHIIPMYQSQP